MTQNYDSFFEQIHKEENILTKARILTYLKKEGLKTKDISLRIGIKPSAVCHMLRLIRLPEIVMDGYYSHLLTISHLFIISRLKNSEDMIKAYEKILSDDLSVMQTEGLIRDMLYHIKSDGSYLSDKERSQYLNELNRKSHSSQCFLIQTRTKSQIILQMKGSLAQTTPWLKNVLKKLLKD